MCMCMFMCYVYFVLLLLCVFELLLFELYALSVYNMCRFCLFYCLCFSHVDVYVRVSVVSFRFYVLVSCFNVSSLLFSFSLSLMLMVIVCFIFVCFMYVPVQVLWLVLIVCVIVDCLCVNFICYNLCVISTVYAELLNVYFYLRLYILFFILYFYCYQPTRLCLCMLWRIKRLNGGE